MAQIFLVIKQAQGKFPVEIKITKLSRCECSFPSSKREENFN